MTSPNPAPATYSPPHSGPSSSVTSMMTVIPVTPRRLNATPDGPITHAWSIGTTRIAQERPAPRRMEECPPEVYIG